MYVIQLYYAGLQILYYGYIFCPLRTWSDKKTKWRYFVINYHRDYYRYHAEVEESEFM